MIEVERKFSANDKALKAILDSVALQKKEKKTFTDIYFDTKNTCLTENNFWLRKRNKKCELKSPTDHRKPDDKLLSSSYKETEQESEIIKLIFPVLYKYSGVIPSIENFENLSECMEHFGVSEFSTIVTHRQSYQLEDFIIDIDTTDTGFTVGEVELMVERPDEIQDSLHKIDAFILKLGLPINDKVPGKISNYLKTHRMWHYKKLYDLKILV